MIPVPNVEKISTVPGEPARKRRILYRGNSLYDVQLPWEGIEQAERGDELFLPRGSAPGTNEAQQVGRGRMSLDGGSKS